MSCILCAHTSTPFPLLSYKQGLASQLDASLRSLEHNAYSAVPQLFGRMFLSMVTPLLSFNCLSQSSRASCLSCCHAIVSECFGAQTLFSCPSIICQNSMERGVPFAVLLVFVRMFRRTVPLPPSFKCLSECASARCLSSCPSIVCQNVLKHGASSAIPQMRVRILWSMVPVLLPFNCLFECSDPHQNLLQVLKIRLVPIKLPDSCSKNP